MMAPFVPRLAAQVPASALPQRRVGPQPGRGVVHIDLAAPFPDRIEPGPFQRSMVVFWWKDVPVGHVFLESSRCSPERIAALAESAVEDDLITGAEDRISAPGRLEPVSVMVCTRDRAFAGVCQGALEQGAVPPLVGRTGRRVARVRLARRGR